MNNVDKPTADNIFQSFPQYKLKKDVAPRILTQTKEDTAEIRHSKKQTVLASSLLSMGVILLLVSKGLQGSSIKDISAHLSSAGKTGKYYAQKGTDRTVGFIQASANFTAMKDVLFDKLLSKTSVTSKFAQKARQISGKIIDNSLTKSYESVSSDISNMSSLIQKYIVPNTEKISEADLKREITIKGETHTLKEWIDILNKEAGNLQNAFDEGFSLGARTRRSERRSELLVDTRDKVYNKFFQNENWKKSETYKSYATEEVTRKSQQEFQTEIIAARKKVTNDIQSIHDSIKNDVSSLELSIHLKDSANSTLLTKINGNILKFKNCSGKTEIEDRKIISEQLIKDLERVKDLIAKNNTYTDTEKEKTAELIENIIFKINSSGEKGALEKIKTILKGLNNDEIAGKKVISDNNHKKLKELSNNISTKLQETTDMEAGEYFLKQAEMVVGSAATDVFSLLMTAGIGTYAIEKCDNKDERISTALKTGIPLIGSVGTFLYGNIKMLSCAKNTLFSIFAGYGLNKLGIYFDGLYQDYKKSGSMVNVAKDEGKNVISDLSVGIKN